MIYVLIIKDTDTRKVLILSFFCCAKNSFSNIGKFAYVEMSLLIEFYSVNKLDKKAILIEFGNTLRKLRLAKGFTQEQLANELGVEISQISRIERGIINTSVTTLYAISIVLKIDASELFVFDKNH